MSKNSPNLNKNVKKPSKYRPRYRKIVKPVEKSLKTAKYFEKVQKMSKTAEKPKKCPKTGKKSTKMSQN